MLPLTVLSTLLFALSATASPLNKRGPVSLPLVPVEQPESQEIPASGNDLQPGPPSANLRVWNIDVKYTTNIAIGTPATQNEVVVDTGSTVLWVKDGDKYSTSKSSTWKPTNQQFSIQYGIGSVSGRLGSDTVTLAGQTLTNQQFGAATQWSEDFNDKDNSTGLMGFAWPKAGHDRPFWQRLADNWSEKVFSFYLKDGSNAQGASPGGVLTLGGTDPTYYTGSVKYVPRVVYPNMEAHWTIPLDSVSVNGKKVGRSNVGAVIDTGTTIVLGPKEDVDDLFAEVPGSNAIRYNNDLWVYTVPCDIKTPIALTFGGTAYTIRPQDIVWQEQAAGCVSGIGASENNDFWIVGDTFLKGHYSAYRLSPPAIGFAKVK